MHFNCGDRPAGRVEDGDGDGTNGGGKFVLASRKAAPAGVAKRASQVINIGESAGCITGKPARSDELHQGRRGEGQQRLAQRSSV
jgi:hypothetical protein